ncbi:MAG TPA: metalloregulator ArsR/SmtB family transcription factor, partial [Candidatus Obscuribacterales bacterium]
MPFAALSSRLEAMTGLTKALADEHRLRMLLLLHRQELCACQIVEAFELANSTISKHLSILRQVGLIHSRKEGRWVYYSLPAEPRPEIASTLAWVRELLQADETVQADQVRIDAILQIDPVELCRRQSGKD